MRYLATFIIAALINLGLFFLIAFMLAGPQNADKPLHSLAAVDFVQVHREPDPPKTKDRRLPKKPEPLPKKPLPMPMHRPQMASPPMSARPPIAFNIEIPLALNSTGPYLGGYRPSSAGPQIKLAKAGSLVPLVRVPPRYPPSAARRGIEGWVKVAFIITQKGTVRNPRVIKAHPPGVFNEAALRAIKRWRFKPKKVHGHWVAQRAVQIIQFHLDQ